jgi:hypothetical protein
MALVMRQLVGPRTAPLLDRLAGASAYGRSAVDSGIRPQ